MDKTEALPKKDTPLKTIPAKNILTRTKNDFWFATDYNMNIYRGCCHGCIYCDSRSDCYQIDDFDVVRAKENAINLLSENLRQKKLKGVIGTGAMSDPYNPFEKREALTRQALEKINAHGFGIAIATKSDLISRDIDLLAAIQRQSPVIVKITITSADDRLSQIIEPYAPLSSERFAAIRKLSDSGIYSGILLMPILPFINDTRENIIAIVHQAYKAGAQFIYPAFGVTLRDHQRLYFYDQLDAHFPGVKDHYIRNFGNRYSCSSPRAKNLWDTFSRECDRLGIRYRMKDIVQAYKINHVHKQLSFFD
jgi:DNA repair photolyase